MKNTVLSMLGMLTFVGLSFGNAMASESNDTGFILELRATEETFQVGDQVELFHIRYSEIGGRLESGGAVVPFKHDRTLASVLEVKDSGMVVVKARGPIAATEKVHMRRVRN